MFRFQDPIYLWLLLIIPIFILFWYISNVNVKRRLRKYGDPKLLKQLMPDVSSNRPRVKYLIILCCISLIILMIAQPQMGTKISNEKRNGIEAIISLDISNSMLAEDVAPSRLDKSKMLVENMIDNFTNDKIGLVVFAGDAFVQLPITSDFVSAKMFLDNITPSLIETQGTDIAKAIHLSINSFTNQDKIGKAIIVITDGEDHEGGVVEACEEAKKNGIKVFILGVGTTKGSPIPVAKGGYLKDNTGQTVLSALNENMCKQIAEAGCGTYIHVDNTNEAQERLNDELVKMQKAEMSTVRYSEYDEQFQAFAILALILLIIDSCILERKNPLFKNIKLFKTK